MNKRNTFAVAFYCRDSKKDRNGLASIEVSLSINSKRVMIGLPIKMNPKTFEKEVKSKRLNETKRYLDSVRQRINDIAMSMDVVTAQGIKDVFLGNTSNSYTTVDALNDYIAYCQERYKAGVCGDTSVQKYLVLAKDIKGFFGNVELCDITVGDVRSYYMYLLTKKKVSTANAFIARLKAVFHYAFDNGKIKTMPFGGLILQKEKVKIEYLTESELNKIRQCSCHGIERLIHVRDSFIFLCLTALSYTDCKNLSPDDILTDEQGNRYINKTRQKTGIEYVVYLCDEAISILEKYEYRLPIPSNQKMNSYLKELSVLSGIDKELHCHLARKTCATLLLNKGVTIEVVARVCGHSNTKVTQKIYAHMNKGSVIDAMKRVM